MFIIHNAAKLREQLERTAIELKKMSDDQLALLLERTRTFNEGDDDAKPWIDLILKEQEERK